MDWRGFDEWLGHANLLLIALVLFAAMCLAAAAGALLRGRRPPSVKGDSGPASDDGQEGYIVSAVLGLLALLMGFTFSIAVDRFDARRHLVLDEANAIGTAYLRAQLLGEPHRARMSNLLVQYTDNRLVLANAAPASQTQRDALARDDALLTEIWAGTAAAFDSIKGLPFSAAYADSMNALIDLNESRRVARAARVPIEVFVVLVIYLVTTAGVMGFVLKGARGRLAAGFLLMLLTLSLVLIIDVNRPVLGGITESQLPMEDLKRSLTAQPPPVFDKYRTPGPEAGDADADAQVRR